MSRWSEDLISVERAGTLDGLFLQRVRRSPGRVAYRFYERDSGWQHLDWRQMGQAVARWRAALAGEALAAGDRVAMLLRKLAGVSLRPVIGHLRRDQRNQILAGH